MKLFQVQKIHIGHNGLDTMITVLLKEILKACRQAMVLMESAPREAE
ncbi:hypothetical protein Pint_11161 [Pistacia integerrima]|uniref:Uncharacterized protein n=1 Tax=Pistacia integerrima TaxID=434235 RepID=A0ACC0XM85_9ROSI|nr:hypothetical protein Pint_11161 [Pistacia integerrima]